MSAPQRMRAWGAGVAAGDVVLGVIATAVLHVPGAPLFFGLCALFALTVSQLTAPLLRPRPPGDDDAGGGGRDPDPPPPWWPEFEREFRAYAERRLTSGRR